MAKNISKFPFILSFFIALFVAGTMLAQDSHTHDHSGDDNDHAQHDHSGHNHDAHAGHDHDKSHGHDHASHSGGNHGHAHGHAAPCEGYEHKTGPRDFDQVEYNENVLAHINDANEIHVVGNFSIPLPCILYAKDKGVNAFLSSKFHHGHNSHKGYVSFHGNVKRPDSKSDFPQDASVPVSFNMDGTKVCANGKTYDLEEASALTGFTSWFDFSISKAVVAMLLASLLLLFIFSRMAARYKRAPGEAPKGIQAVFEPLIVFLTDNVIKPIIGPKYIKYAPFLLTLFFFIAALNLMGLIPGFGFNATGNLAITLALAVITLIVYLVSGNKHYWQHVFALPGLPKAMYLIITPIEMISNFILKPATLMLRLFANITGGHIVILSLVGLIFLFGNNGQSMGGGALGGVVATVFVLFMNILELLVAFLQAFIFMTLATVYIGQAVEEPHHAEHY